MGKYDDIAESIEKWHEADEHLNIIDAVLTIPEEERGYMFNGVLARAYNNVGEYEQALELLSATEDEGQYDLIWHFRIGYAYYYLDQLEAAEKAFARVLASDPGDEDAQDFYNWIQDELKEAAAIKPEQEKAALEDMVEWLSHENELGAPPEVIEPAGEFDLHGFRYYIFKYKKTVDEPWLLGVAGGYRRHDLDHCGHIFSEMEEYIPETAEEKAIALVEMLQEAWRNEAEKLEGFEDSDELSDENLRTGPFTGFVLLNSFEFDIEQVKAHLKNDWGILYENDWNIIVKDEPIDFPNASLPDSAEITADIIDEIIHDSDVSESSLVLEHNGMIAAVSLIEMPVPNGEAERFAETNYMWPEAVAKTQTHVAQILVTVLFSEKPPIEAAKLFSKVVSCCLKLENAVGVYTSGTVFSPEFYIDISDAMKEGELPVPNWIYFGIYGSDGEMNGYTYGLRSFGKYEIEIRGSTESAEAVHEFLTNISYYILIEDVDLKDGETIGFTEFQKFKIEKSKGVALDGDTLKIDFWTSSNE